jgi:hypothetical protein
MQEGRLCVFTAVEFPALVHRTSTAILPTYPQYPQLYQQIVDILGFPPCGKLQRFSTVFTEV